MSPPRGSSVPTDSYPGGVARGLRPNGVLAHSPPSVGIERALSDRRTFLRQRLLPHQPFWPGKSEILKSAVENARFVVTSISSASAVPSSLDRRHNCNSPIATVCWGFDEMRVQAALSAVDASRSIFAAMMKSFSWRPLIFLVRSDTVP